MFLNNAILLKKKYLAFAASIFLSFFFIYLSFNRDYWIIFFKFFFVPVAFPPFSDFDALVRFLKCFNNDLINNYCSEVIEGTSGYYDYPETWLYIFKYLNLSNYYYFNLAVFIILFFYFYALFYLSNFFNNYKDKLIFLLAVISTSNLLLIERLNVDVVIFLLLFCLVLNIKVIIKYFIFFLTILLKIYPIFSILVFLNKKKDFVVALFFSFLAIYILKESVIKINNILLEFGTTFAYGSRSISKAFYFLLSKHFDYFIAPNNYKILTYFLEIIFLVLVSIIISIGFFSKYNKRYNIKLKINEQTYKFYILGSSIYIFTFVFGSNADYRLVFLFLTLPCILKSYNFKIKMIFLISLLVSLNSFIFTVNDKFSLLYIINGSAVYLCKLTILIILSYTLGAMLRNYLFKLKYINF
jgi:hypothetical protein